MKNRLTFYRLVLKLVCQSPKARFPKRNSQCQLMIMSKKTERKNKTNLNPNWPTTPFFTIEDLQALNPDAKEITLRVRLNTRRDDFEAVEIGTITGGQGRPKKVFAFMPVPEETYVLAESQKISVDRTKAQKASEKAAALASTVTPQVTPGVFSRCVKTVPA